MSSAKYILTRVGRIATVASEKLHGRELSFDVTKISQMSLWEAGTHDAQLVIQFEGCCRARKEKDEQEIRFYHPKTAELRKLRHDISKLIGGGEEEMS